MDAEKKKKLMIQASEIREKTVELIYHGGGDTSEETYQRQT